MIKMSIDENVLDILLSVIPYGWKTYVNEDGKFYAGFVTVQGILGFEMTGDHWCKISTPVVPKIPEHMVEATHEILEGIATRNLRYPSRDDIDIINRFLERDIFSLYEEESDVVRYLLFYRG
jgi:hypothetical protein